MFLSAENTNSISQMLTLLLLFAFVLFITYYTTKFLANYQKGKASDSNIGLMEAVRLSQNKYLQIVRIGKKYYALAISKDNVNVICEVPEEELKLNDDMSSAAPKFKDILSRFKNTEQTDVCVQVQSDEEAKEENIEEN